MPATAVYDWHAAIHEEDAGSARIQQAGEQPGVGGPSATCRPVMALKAGARQGQNAMLYKVAVIAVFENVSCAWLLCSGTCLQLLQGRVGYAMAAVEQCRLQNSMLGSVATSGT